MIPRQLPASPMLVLPRRVEGQSRRTGFSTLVLVWVPPAVPCVSCFWRLLIFERWPGRKPFGGAEKPPITFIRELMQQVRLGLVLLGAGQSAISGGAGVAHSVSHQLQQNRDSSPHVSIRSSNTRDLSDQSPYLRAAPQHPTPWGTANENPRHEGRGPPWALAYIRPTTTGAS